MELLVVSKDRPKWLIKPKVEYQIHHLVEEEILLAIVTVYTDGSKTFEFNNDKRYSTEEIEAILRVGMELTA